MGEKLKGFSAIFWIGIAALVVILGASIVFVGVANPGSNPTSGSNFSCADVAGDKKCDNGNSQASPETEEKTSDDVAVPNEADGGSTVFEISPSDLYSQMTYDGVHFTLIDVRGLYEYKVEHLAGAVLLPLEDINQADLDKMGITKGENIVVYCNAGVRSAKAYLVLKSLGYTNVKSMTGGIVEWNNEGFPTESD